jgi:hypothetical protein
MVGLEGLDKLKKKKFHLIRDSSDSTNYATGKYIALLNGNFLHVVQTGCGAHPASYPMGTGTLSPGAKRQGREADHSSPASAEIKKRGSIHPLPHTSSWLSG